MIVASLFILTRCSTTRPLADKPPDILKGISDADALLEIVRATDIPYTWYSASGTGTIDWDDQRLSAKVTVRIRKDSVIWAQISKLGFEVGRMLVTPDSAFFINRIERTYARYGTSQFFEKYNLPADFDMFSKVFTGGAYIPSSITSLTVENDGALLIKANGVSARHYLDTQRSLVRSQVMDPNHHEWTALYDLYTTVNTGQKFPFHRANTLVIDGKANLFDLDYESVMIDVPQDLPFSIPSHYEKM